MNDHGLIMERNHKVGRQVVDSKLSLACLNRSRGLYEMLIDGGFNLD